MTYFSAFRPFAHLLIFASAHLRFWNFKLNAMQTIRGNKYKMLLQYEFPIMNCRKQDATKDVLE